MVARDPPERVVPDTEFVEGLRELDLTGAYRQSGDGAAHWLPLDEEDPINERDYGEQEGRLDGSADGESISSY